MFAIRASSAGRLRPLLSRANATLQTASSSSTTQIPPSPALSESTTTTTTTNEDAEPSVNASSAVRKPAVSRGRRRRPSISLANPRTWNRPVPEGFLPAYDEAVKLIQRDSQELKAELEQLRGQIEKIRAENSGDKDNEELERLVKKAEVVEIQSEINLPDVRWYFANGMADLSKPVYRHLSGQKWRKQGALDLLMERLHQMNVIPDVLSAFHPSFDLRLTFPEPPPKSTYLRTRVKRRYAPVEPGVFLLPEQTRQPPRLYATVFHPETRYYTLVLVDADVPDPERNGFTTYLHWMVPNIALSASTPSPLLSSPSPTSAPQSAHTQAHTHSKYIPPHPQRGSPYHRYCLFLLPNPRPDEKVVIPRLERGGFDMREFCETYGFEAEKGGASHMWREVWDATVSDIYKETLKLPEPHYALPPRRDPYADVKNISRYSK